MADNDDGCLWLGVIGIAALGYWYFKEDEAPKIAAYPPPALVTAAANAAVEGAGKPVSPPLPKAPVHNYIVREGLVYYYQSALSEDERKAGRSTGDVIGYRYLGKQGDLHKLQRVNGYGQEISSASCTSPCKLIRYSDGERIAYNPVSIIGSAFEDAMRGSLKVYSPPQPKQEYWQQAPTVEQPIDEEPIATEPTAIDPVVSTEDVID